MMHLDTRRVIAEVEKRPDLWDPSDNDYCFVEARMESWRDVCRGIFKNFDDMDKDARARIVTKVRKRWNTARTAYMKVQKYRKNKAAAKKPYICTYYHRLVFLDKRLKLTEGREEAERIEIEAIESAPAFTIKQEEIEIKPDKSAGVNRIEIEDDVAEMGLNYKNLSSPEEEVRKDGDDDRAFLMSFLPMLKKLDEDQKLNFRLETMRLLIRVKNRQSATSS